MQVLAWLIYGSMVPLIQIMSALSAIDCIEPIFLGVHPWSNLQTRRRQRSEHQVFCIELQPLRGDCADDRVGQSLTTLKKRRKGWEEVGLDVE